MLPLGKSGYDHYTDGIYATTFFIRDIGNFKAQQFSHAFKRRFGREPDEAAATSYDAAAIAVEAIKRAKPGGDLVQSHERIRSQLTTFCNIETAYQGVTGRIYFDEHGNAMKPFPVGEWHLQGVLVFSDISATDSTLGNPRMFHATADTDINYSRFNVVTEIERNAKNYVLNNLIPLFIIILIGYAMLFISPHGPPFVARMNLGVTAILLSMKASSQLPDIGHLVALYCIYFAFKGLVDESLYP